MRILLFGKNGQIGSELHKSFATLGDVTAPARDDRNLCGDLGDLNGIAATIRKLRPEIILNAAAYTHVDQAESEPDHVNRVNADAPGVMAREAKDCDALLVHYSTDYVFDGTGTAPWSEGDLAKPLNKYGYAKLDGERQIQKAGGRHLIFRSSWIYSTRGYNFLKTVLRLAQERDRLTIVDDQLGAPTAARLVSDVTRSAVIQTLDRPEACGLYHVAATGETSWYEYARLIIKLAGEAECPLSVALSDVRPITSEEFLTSARRPKNSRLNTHKLQDIFGLGLPAWQKDVRQTVRELLGR